MATPVMMPRLGQSVEFCTINEWLKKKGDSIAVGDVLFTYETDKASFEFESIDSGILLEIFAEAGAEVPVLTNVAALGTSGENASALRPSGSSGVQSAPTEEKIQTAISEPADVHSSASVSSASPADGILRISPRAKELAERKGIDAKTVAGSGPMGRIIERDIDAAAVSTSPMTRTARAKAEAEGLASPGTGSGIGSRVRSGDLTMVPRKASGVAASTDVTATTIVKLTQIRKIIGERMMKSLQETAQLTMTTYADARALLAFRADLKKNAESLNLANISINDLVAFALTRVLRSHQIFNAHYMGDHILQFERVHLAMAVDTPRGLMVPVVRDADLLSLNDLALSIKSVAGSCLDGTINPDLLSGGTITMSNLGSFGIDSFTPVLNVPQVALLGVNTISPRGKTMADGSMALIPHIGLSLTFDHRAADGAPAARFLKALADAIEHINLSLSL